MSGRKSERRTTADIDNTPQWRFFWQSSSTSARIRAIQDAAQRQRARAAKKYLLQAQGCSYGRFESQHLTFLSKHPHPEERTCRRRLQFIETPGLETSLWPHLFYNDSLCLTVVRSTDARRVGGARGPTLEAFVRGDAGSDTDDDEDADGRRHSVKRAYSALALSARLGYGSSYEVLHFAYDLNLWSALGAKKTTSREYDAPMRVLMKGHSFSPLYWRGVHCALLDMVRQVGYPKIFWTISPYEWSMPYHVWLRDEMAKELRGRLHLAVAESLHVTHVLLQVVRGVLAGRTGKPSRDPWQRHLLQAVGPGGEVHPVHVFLRVEFQDGTRKAPTQDYHGSGRPHIHVLVFASTQAVHVAPRHGVRHHAGGRGRPGSLAGIGAWLATRSLGPQRLACTGSPKRVEPSYGWLATSPHARGPGHGTASLLRGSNGSPSVPPRLPVRRRRRRPARLRRQVRQ